MTFTTWLLLSQDNFYHQTSSCPFSSSLSSSSVTSLTRVTSVKSANAQWVSDWVTPITSWASCYATNLAQLKLIWVAMVWACLCLVWEWVELGVEFAASNLSGFLTSIGKDWRRVPDVVRPRNRRSCTTIPYVFSCRYGLFGMWHLTS